MSDDPQQTPEKFADEQPYTNAPGVEAAQTPDDSEDDDQSSDDA